jgi:hypothetical protein
MTGVLRRQVNSLSTNFVYDLEERAKDRGIIVASPDDAHLNGKHQVLNLFIDHTLPMQIAQRGRN